MNAAAIHHQAATHRAAQARASAQRLSGNAPSTTATNTRSVVDAGATAYAHVRRAAQPRRDRWRARGTLVLTAITVIAVHGAVVWLASAARTHTATRLPQSLPMTVTLTSAPRPLPQAAPATAAPRAEPPREAKPPKPVDARPREHHEHVAAPAPSPAPPPAAAPAAAPAQSEQQTKQGPVQQTPPATAAAPETHSPQTSAPIGNAAYLRNPAPDYPQIAQDQGWEGRVLLRVHVLADGSPDSVAVQTGSGRRVLDEAAREAVQHWRFVPARRGDEAVDGWVTVPIDFRLAQ